MRIMTRIKAVFFDIDNTLFDQDRAHRAALCTLAQRYTDIFHGVGEEDLIDAFLTADKKALEEFHSGIPLNVIRLERQLRILRILRLDEGFAEEMTKVFYDLYPRMNTPIDHAGTVVKTLRERYAVGVISNGSRKVQYQKLDAIGLTELFQCVVLSEEIGIRKPDPRIFWTALESFDAAPEETLYVGDSYHADVCGAKNAGMKVCWMNHRSQPSGDIHPDFTIQSLDEIMRAL
jgi:putative hydrolase of the HAD superfamily